MKHILSKIKLFIATILTSLLFVTPCFAANSSIVLKTDRTDLSNGEEITITADLPDDQKIYAMTATLQYDENVFEPIDNYNFSIPDTAALSYNAQNNQFGIINQDGAVDDNLLVIRLKVKDDAHAGDTNIALSNISTSDGQNTTEYSTASTKVMVTHDATDDETVPTNSENAIVESTTEAPNVLFTAPFIIAAVVMVGVIILVAILYFGNLTPHTSKLYYGLVCLGVVIVVLTIAVGVITNNREDVNGDGQVGYSDAQSIIDYLIDLRGEDGVENDSSATNNSDANTSGNNSNTSINPTSSNQRYTIGFNNNYNNTTSNNSSNATTNGSSSSSGTRPPQDFDTNNDGKVDIGDAGHNAEEADKKTSVTLSAVSSTTQSRLVDKNHDSIIFAAKIEPAEVKLTKATVDGREYDVEDMGNGEYMVKIDPTILSSAGIHKLKISSVQTSNHKTLDANHEVEFEVRKDAPRVEQFNHDKQNETISFVLYDPDNAFQEGQTHIYSDTNLEEPIVSHDINKEGANNIEHDFEDDTVYLIDVKGNYCLTIATEGDNSECYKDISFHSHTFTMLEDYSFTLSEFSVSDYVEPGQYPLLNFKSANTKGLMVTEAKVKIDNADYIVPVAQTSDGSYQAILSQAPMASGKHQVNLESVDLSNSQVFKNGDEDAFRTNELSYFVPKNVPKVENLQLADRADEKLIDAKFSLNDPNQSVSKLTVILTDSTNRNLASQTLSQEEITSSGGNFSIALDHASARDKALKVEVYADYDLGDKYNFENVLLSESSINLFQSTDLYIDNIASRNMLRNEGKGEITRYADKGQKQFWLMFNLVKNIDLFNIYGAKYSTNTGYTVNGVNYNSFGPGVEKYNAAVALGIPDTAGVIDLVVSRTQYATNPYYKKTDDWFSIPRRDYRIEVLKDKPQIANFKTIEDLANHSVTFKFDVVLDATAKEGDESFKSGVLKFGDQEQTFNTRGTNEITFHDVELNHLQDLTIKASYDLDTDTLNDEDNGRDLNEFDNELLFQTKYGLYDADTFDNVKVVEARALTNDKEVNDQYFEKNQQIGLYFKLSGIPEELNSPVKITLDNKAWEYELLQIVDDAGNTEPNSYAAFIPGYNDAGQKSVRISSIILENGKVIELGENDLARSPKIDFEILKDIPTITDIQYKKDGDKIILNSKLSDQDKAILGNAQVTIVDELNKTIYTGSYQEELEINNQGETLFYVTVDANYRRSTNEQTGSNNYHVDHAELLNTTISLEENDIIIKEITNVNLYLANENGGTTLVDTISKDDLNRDQSKYYVEITSNHNPTTYLEITGAEDRDGKLYLVLNANHLELENGLHTIGNNNPLLEFGTIINDNATNKYHQDLSEQNRQDFTKLIEQLENGTEVTLEQDYDASSFSVPSNGYYISNFTGTLNGKGHSIKNLKGALFQNLSGTVENLYLENVNVEINGRGSLAYVANNAKVKNVAVYGAYLSNGDHQTGGLIGNVENNTEIDSVAITNLKMNVGGGIQQVGGLAGVIRNNSTIKNSYVIGQISGTSGYVGGIVGSNNHATASTVENCYAKVSTKTINPSCGIGCIYTGKTNFIHNISFGSNYTSPITNDFDKSPKLEGNFYLTPSGQNFTEHEGQTAIENAGDIKQPLFTKAEFNSDTWRLDGSVSIDNPPKLKFEKIDTNAIENIAEYRSENAAIYSNISKLSPYYDNQKIVKDGNKETLGSDLKDKQIQHIAPVDAMGNLVTYLTTNHPDTIAKLRIVFTDGSRETYDVNYVKTYDMVATYRIPKLHIDYIYPHYVIDANSRAIDNLVYYLKGLTYNNNLDTLTTNSDSRLYRDFYNTTTVNELKDFVLKYLSNSDYTNTSTHDGVSGQIERAVKKDNRLVKALYVYNYFHRFYDLDIDGMKLYDFVFFNMQGFNSDFTPEYIVEAYFSDQNNFNTNNTHGAYRNVFSASTGLGNISKFLEFVVQHFGVKGQSMSDWVHTQFKGFLAERSIDQKPDYSSDGQIPVSKSPFKNEDTGVRYTLWDHLYYPDALQNSDTSYAVYNYVLPILTLPKDSTYIISTPVQFIIGSQRTYLNPVDPRGADVAREAFNFRVNAYANRMKTYFTTAYGLIHDKNILNNMNLYQLDKIMVYDENGISYKARPGSTEDPHHKNFNEAIGRFSADGGINAGAYSDRVEFDVAGVMDANIKEVADKYGGNHTENTFGTWSHETAHMIDARLWLENNGRRWDSGGEDYADGNLRQEFSSNLILMNLSVDWGQDCGFGSNCSPERIDTQAELSDYYSKVFDAIYALDYLEGLVFLQLEPDQMSQIAMQASYPNEHGEGFTGALQTNFPNGLIADPMSRWRAYHTTKYTKLGADAYQQMKNEGKLNTVDDLYDNKLVVYPGIYSEASYGDNKYGSEGLGQVHWYQPHNPYGRPDSYSLKWLAYEMMGYGGYKDGYVEYYSNIHPETEPYTYYNNFETKSTTTATNYKTDDTAFKKIIKNYTTFENYKKGRFDEIAQKLNQLNQVVDVKQFVSDMYVALLQDVKRQTVDLQAFFNKKHPNGALGEEQCLKDQWCVNGYAPYGWDGVVNYINKQYSTNVRVQFFQALKKATHDFTDDIFTNRNTQGFSDINELVNVIKAKKAELTTTSQTSALTETETKTDTEAETGTNIEPES